MGTTRITSTQSNGHARFTLECDVIATEGVGSSANKYGRWKLRFWGKAVNVGDKTSGYEGSGTQYLQRNGSTVHAHGANPFLKKGVKPDVTRWHDGPYDVWVNANSQGYWSGTLTSMPLQMRLDYSTIDVTPTGSITLSRISQKPGTVATPTVSNQLSNAITVTWKAPTTGGSAITKYEIQYATNSGFTSASTATAAAGTLSRQITGLKPATNYWFRVRAVTAAASGDWSGAVRGYTLPVALQTPSASNITPTQIEVDWTYGLNTTGSTSAMSSFELRWADNAGFSGAHTITGMSPSTLKRVITGLAPNTTYYFQVRGRTPAGVGPWSPTLAQATLPTSLPGFTVSPAPGGRMATLSFTPPGDVTGVTSYEYRYRRAGATKWIGPVSSRDAIAIQQGLVPGATYEWQGAAVVGGYVSPWTATVTKTQPRPNMDPGSYFDGATPATAVSTFAWVGTAGKSASTAAGLAVTGWAPFTADGSGATGKTYQALGGAFGSGCYRTQIWDPPTTGLVHQGTATTNAAYMAAVKGGYPVEASIQVNPLKVSSYSAYVLFYSSSLTFISAVAGPGSRAAANIWTRLVVDTVAPSNAAYAAVHWIEDPTGASYVRLAAGDFVDADAAQITLGQSIPYFNGSFQDSNQWSYAWSGATNASTSIRTATTTPVRDPLQDPDCDPLPVPPAPPVIDDDCVITDDRTWLRYWTTIPTDAMPAWQSVMPILTLTTGGTAIRQVRIRYYQNPFGRTRESLAVDSFCAEQVISYIPPGYHLVLDGVTQEAWANAVVEVPGLTPGTVPAGQLLYGSGGGPASWPELTCGIRYEMAVDVLADSYSLSFNTELDTAIRW